MKKFIAVFSICVCILALAACGNQQTEDMLHLGVKVIITEIDTTNKIITVKDSDGENILGGKCNIDCSNIPMIYCDYDTGELKSVCFEDLQVNDEILLGIYSSEIQKVKSEDDNLSKIEVRQIQLGTQRLNSN